MSDPELLYEVRERVAWLTLNRPDRRNAISPGMIALFFEHLDQAEADDAVRVLCISHVGDRAFCSGADLMGGGEDGPLAATREYARLLKRLAVFPKPLVARLDGSCLAGGLGLMLSCDVVYARAGVSFSTPEVKVGLFPMMIGALIFRNVQRKKALEMVYTGRQYSAAEAAEMGLITRCYDDSAGLDAAVEETLAAIGRNAPVAIRVGRQAFAAVQDRPLEPALDHLCEQLGVVLATEDAAEGLQAFFQKREPDFQGK